MFRSMIPMDLSVSFILVSLNDVIINKKIVIRFMTIAKVTYEYPIMNIVSLLLKINCKTNNIVPIVKEDLAINNDILNLFTGCIN